MYSKLFNKKEKNKLKKHFNSLNNYLLIKEFREIQIKNKYTNKQMFKIVIDLEKKGYLYEEDSERLVLYFFSLYFFER